MIGVGRPWNNVIKLCDRPWSLPDLGRCDIISSNGVNGIGTGVEPAPWNILLAQ